MTTSLTINLSTTLQNTLNQQGVFAYAVYFDSLGVAHWTSLIDGTTAQPVVTSPATITLPTPMNGGKIYLLIQSQAPGAAANLPTQITQQSDISIADPSTGSGALQYRYDSFEVTLAGAAADAGNLTDVTGFGIPMSISVAYPNGDPTQTRGYNINGASVFSAISGINTQLLSTYSSGPLAGCNRLALSPVSALTNDLPGASATDWVPYVEALNTVATGIQIAGYFNGAPSVDWLVYEGSNYQYLDYHNPGFYSYAVSWVGEAKGQSGTYTLTPASNSQIQGIISITSTALANSIYATLGSATVSNASGTAYAFTSLSNSGSVQSSTAMNTGANNQWGAAFVKLLTGFIGGYLGGSATALNAALPPGSIDLNKNWNFDPTFAFHGSATAGQPGCVTPFVVPPSYGSGVPYDKFAEVFFQHSNSYGNGYSDALTNMFAQGGPLIPVGYVVDPGPPLQQADVSAITLTVYDDKEPSPATAQGYTPTVIYNTSAGPFVAPLGSIGAPNLSLILSFGLGQMRLDPTATVSLGFYTSTTAGLAQFTSVAIPSSSTLPLFQTWVFQGGTTPTFIAGGAPAPTGSLLQLNGLPYDTGVNWYQITVSNKTTTRTYNLYASAVSGTGVLNPYYTSGTVNQAGSIAIDGLASVPPGTSDQYWTSVNIAAFSGGTLSMDPALMAWITDASIINAPSNAPVWPTPNMPVLGTLAGSVFSNWGGSSTLDTPNAPSSLASVTSADLVFAWWGADQAWVGYNVSQTQPKQVLSAYTNKVNGGNTVLISFASGGIYAAHAPISVGADIDGKWVTKALSPAEQFTKGTYSATMTEYLPTDTSFTTPVAATSAALVFTVVSPPAP